MFEIRECRSEEVWNSYVDRYGGLHHRYEWSHINRDLTGSPTVHLAAYNADEIVAIYPFVRRGRWPLLWFVSPTDFGGGPIGDPEAIRALIREVNHRAKRERANTNLIRCDEKPPDLSDDFDCDISPRQNLVVDLDRPREEIWRSFKSQVRNSVRKSQKQGIDVSEGREEDLEDYLDLVDKHSASIGYRPRSHMFIRSLFRYLDATLIVAIYEKSMVGGCIYLNFKGRASCINATRDPEHNRLRIGEALHWGGICHYSDKGYRDYDFMSRNDNRIVEGKPVVAPDLAALHRFKMGWRPNPVINYDILFTYSKAGIRLRRLLAGARNQTLRIKSTVKLRLLKSHGD